ncbi:hypothetical protein AB0E63_38040 [Kribbella sp. NPDC026596]|uniref:hypothetical protein n=1 Tax=Kribbella sp. NPDC026596 TaxID=3155122 RepID=UPI0033E4BB23
MADDSPRRRGDASLGKRESQVERWASTRRPYLDNLKVVLIAAIIVIHAVLGYASIEVWTSTEFREVTLTTATQVVLFALVSPFAFFLIALLFLVAGLLTPSSLQRKGTARFLGDRSPRRCRRRGGRLALACGRFRCRRRRTHCLRVGMAAERRTASAGAEVSMGPSPEP